MREVVRQVGPVVFRYQSLTAAEVAEWRAKLARDSTCPACGLVAVIVEQWERFGMRQPGTLYLHGDLRVDPTPVPSCWIPADE